MLIREMGCKYLKAKKELQFIAPILHSTIMKAQFYIVYDRDELKIQGNILYAVYDFDIAICTYIEMKNYGLQ